MTVSSENVRNDYLANGASCQFSYTFKILSDTSLDVYQCNTLITSGYTVSGAGSETGGTVTFDTTPTSGDAIALVHSEPFTQTIDLVDHNSSPAATIEGGFDKGVMLAQQVRGLVAATLHFNAGSAFAAAGAEVADLQGGKLLRVGNDCDTIEMVDVATISPSSVTVPLSIANGGTNASSKASARANLDAAPVQAPYLLLGTNSELTCERNVVFRGVRVEDAGCGSTLTLTTCTKGFSLVRRNASFSCTSTANSQCTRMVLAASVLALESSCLDLVFVKAPNNVTNDIGVDVTNKQNSRDQTGAFTAGQDVHFYWTYFNGSAVSRSSVTAPPTGPTLPACETHWAYSHSVPYDGNCMPAVTVRGDSVFYDCATTVLSAGAATCQTRISLVSVVPAIATRVYLTVKVTETTSAANPNEVILGHRLNCIAWIRTRTTSDLDVDEQDITLPNVNQELYYRINGAGAPTLTLSVRGYDVPGSI